MLFIHAHVQFSTAKQACSSYNIVLCPLCFGAVVWLCVPFLQKPSFRHILNAEISRFSKHLGAVPSVPHIWHCLLGQTRTSLLKSTYGPVYKNLLWYIVAIMPTCYKMRYKFSHKHICNSYRKLVARLLLMLLQTLDKQCCTVADPEGGTGGMCPPPIS